MNNKAHWENVYQSKAPDAVSWYSPHLETSLALIRTANSDPRAAIIDVGGGESTLIADLLLAGYQNLSVVDISRVALDVAKKRIGKKSDGINWIEGDILDSEFASHSYDVWHDRAVFHFLTTPEQRIAYVRQISLAVKPGGHVIVATFAPDGPEKCSGLDVVRYDAASLHAQFGSPFTLISSKLENHKTPLGSIQQFLYCLCKIAPTM